MNLITEHVKQFHTSFGCSISDIPQKPTKELSDLRIKLLKEEWEEYLQGESDGDLVKIADGLGDMAYVIWGTAISYGIPLDKVLDEIHRSNMSKLGKKGTVMKREDGKILKGPDFFKPNIAKVLWGEASDDC